MSWELEVQDLKHYPHFDAELGIAKAHRLVNDPKKVASNPFYPFIMYLQEWQPFRSKSPRPKRKIRKIRYAARKDAYIFAKYRHELAEIYEKRLADLGLSETVIAYRRILKKSQTGKCNIDFAKDAFDAIKKFGNCCFIALDISQFFENIDHQRLRGNWESLLEVDSLPPDHAAVFKAVTSYAYVERDDLYRRLGYIQKISIDGKERDTYTKKFDKMPKKLCTNKEFRDLVIGRKGANSGLIVKNPDSWGIPQGAPISDFLANLYLMDFDLECNKVARIHGGAYWRYSDDILFVLPVSAETAHAIESFAIKQVKSYGSNLQIKSEKSSIVEYFRDGSILKFRHVKGQQGKNGAEYLGFRFDGKSVYLRDSTVSALFRKISTSAKAHAYSTVSRFPGKDINFLEKKLSPTTFFERFGRARDFDPSASSSWTFRSYAQRAISVFGAEGMPIARQLKNARQISTKRLQRHSPKRSHPIRWVQS